GAVGRRGAPEPAAHRDEPGPAAAELADCRCLELLLELVEAAAVAIDRLRDVAAWRAAATRLHRVPKEGVVPHLRRVVEDTGLRGIAIGRLDDLLERLALHRRALDEIVEVGDVGLVVLVVVEIE